MAIQRIGIEISAAKGPGILHELSGAIARHQGNILSVEIIEDTAAQARVYFEIDAPGEPSAMVRSLMELPVVSDATLVGKKSRLNTSAVAAA